MAIFDLILAVCVGVACAPVILLLMAGHVAFTVIPRHIHSAITSIRRKAN